MARLPDYERAIIEPAKLRYCLDPTHPSGQHKARVFESALGLTLSNTAALERVLRDGIAAHEAEMCYTFPDGTERWVVEWIVLGRLGPMLVISAWNRRGSGPRLISCYMKKVKR